MNANFNVEARQKHLEALPGWSHGGMETKSQQRYQCAGTCGQMLGRESFTDTQWLQGVRKKCIDCCQNSGRPRVNTQSQRQKCQGSCGQDLSKDMFAARQWHRNERICIACNRRPRVDTQKCQGSCGQELSKDMFAARQWHANERICKACSATKRTGKRTQENVADASSKSKRTKK